MMAWLKWYPAPGGGEPDVTGGLLLHTPSGDGEVPSGLCPMDPPGHHQNGLASSKHHPGRASGHGSRAAQEVKGSLRQKTKTIGEEGGLREWDRDHQRDRFPRVLTLPTPLHMAPTYVVLIRGGKSPGI